MDSRDTPSHLDRGVLQTRAVDADQDLEFIGYWAGKSYTERLDCMEQLRRDWWGENYEKEHTLP